jgi:hypothetical protein
VKFLVDANILIEPTKTTPDPKVVEWLWRNDISDEQSVLDFRQYALALRHCFMFAFLQVGYRTAVLRGHAVPFAVRVFEKRRQTMMFGRRRR